MATELKPGIGIDRYGNQVIDPTKNVEDLVKALESALDKLRMADARRLDDLRAADNRRIDDLMQAEIRFGVKLAEQKDRADEKIFNIQTVQVKTTSDLISAQLAKETASLANRQDAASVQQQGLISTLSERIGKLEQARWEVSGRSSVQDPATADALARITTAIQATALTQGTSEGRGVGRSDAWGWLIGVIGAASAIAAIVVLFSRHAP